MLDNDEEELGKRIQKSGNKNPNQSGKTMLKHRNQSANIQGVS